MALLKAMVDRDDWRERFQLDDSTGYRDPRLSLARLVMGAAGLAAAAVALLVALI